MLTPQEPRNINIIIQHCHDLQNAYHQFHVIHDFFNLATYIGPQALPFSGITKSPQSWPVGANVKSWEQVLAISLMSTGMMFV